jgi:PAS domain S-box-containing protein
MREVDPLDIIETIREGLLVLDPDLTVRFANRSFCGTFAVTPEATVSRKLYELGDGQWDIPELRSMIETILAERTTIEAFEVDRVFPSIGRRVMLLNARKVYRADNHTKQVLVAIEDVTEQRRLEHEHAAAHERIAVLLQELDGRGADPRRADSGLGGRLIDIFAQQLGGEVARESGNTGTIVCLTLPSREASYDRRA